MSKVSAFYKTFFQRGNLVRQIVLEFFFGICSWPRLVLEVFLRRKMGERYFSLFGVLAITFVLWRIPAGLQIWRPQHGFFGPFTLWYVFMFAFLGMGLYRKWQMRRLPQSFDFKHFSMSTGDRWPQLECITWQGKPYAFSPLVVETLIEPATAIVPGALLWWGLDQYLGILLMGCGIIYSLSYVAAYQQGKDFLLDQIDREICQMSLGETMSEGLAPDFTRGVKFPGDLPDDPAARQQIAAAFLNEEAAYAVR